MWWLSIPVVIILLFAWALYWDSAVNGQSKP